LLDHNDVGINVDINKPIKKESAGMSMPISRENSNTKSDLNEQKTQNDVGINVGINDPLTHDDVGINESLSQDDVGINLMREVLLLLIKDNKITTNEIAEKFEVSVRTIERKLKKLREYGFIKRVGSNKSGYWDIDSQKD
jgi:ATP-dependent DNA helicase RecG